MSLFSRESDNLVKKLDTPAAVIHLIEPGQMTVVERPSWHLTKELNWSPSLSVAVIPPDRWCIFSVRVPWLFFGSLTQKKFLPGRWTIFHLQGISRYFQDYSIVYTSLEVSGPPDWYCTRIMITAEKGKAIIIGSITVQGSGRSAGVPKIRLADSQRF